jgi:hypothetical protein
VRRERTVGKVPEGFALQGADSLSLEIARRYDSALCDFRGRLALQSKSLTTRRAGKAVEVDGSARDTLE